MTHPLLKGDGRKMVTIGHTSVRRSILRVLYQNLLDNGFSNHSTVGTFIPFFVTLLIDEGRFFVVDKTTYGGVIRLLTAEQAKMKTEIVRSK